MSGERNDFLRHPDESQDPLAAAVRLVREAAANGSRIKSGMTKQEPGRRRRTPASLATLAITLSTPALAQSATTDPAGSGPILGALEWIEGTLLGNLATTAAVIAVAVVGLMMLTGRIDWKRGLTVVLGAFILFGAVAIVAGMRSIAGGLH